MLEALAVDLLKPDNRAVCHAVAVVRSTVNFVVRFQKDDFLVLSLTGERIKSLNK